MLTCFTCTQNVIPFWIVVLFNNHFQDYKAILFPQAVCYAHYEVIHAKHLIWSHVNQTITCTFTHPFRRRPIDTWCRYNNVLMASCTAFVINRIKIHVEKSSVWNTGRERRWFDTFSICASCLLYSPYARCLYRFCGASLQAALGVSLRLITMSSKAAEGKSLLC